MRNFAWGACVLLGGCFSSPPAVGDVEGGETGTGAEATTSAASTTGGRPTSTTQNETSFSTSGSTSTADSGSSFATSVWGTSTTRGTSQTSGSGTTGGSTAGVVCEAGRVEIEGTCLAPLVVSSALSVLGGGGGGPFDDMSPCLQASCGADLPLGGGFESSNVALHRTAADFDMGAWGICGAPTDPPPSTWDVSARCAVSTGDVLTVTEGYPLPDDALGCFDAECPDGTSVVGGGGRWGPEFLLTGSQPTGDGRWEVCGRALDEKPLLEVDAYCAVLPAGASIQLAEATAPVDTVTVGCAEAVCASGIAIAGGGDGGPVASTLEILGPAEIGDAWMACGRAVIGMGEIRSTVLCYES